VEVGNIFPLETKYTNALDVYYTDENGEKQEIIMGCYGIGISRLMGVVAEHFSDDKGLVWPDNIAPFRVYLATIGDVSETADALYKELSEKGIEVLYDDRDARPGEKFADSELMGIPHRVVISPKLVEQGTFEYKARTSDEARVLTKKELLAILGAAE
jgi:prolyl-tRNA synthetase